MNLINLTKPSKELVSVFRQLIEPTTSGLGGHIADHIHRKHDMTVARP